MARAAASLCVALGALHGVPAAAQGQAGLAPTAPAAGVPGGAGLVPSVSLSQSYLRTSGTLDGRSRDEFITRVSPGLSWTSRAGRVQGSVNYVADLSVFSRRDDNPQLNNNLSAALRGTVVQDRAWVDVQAFAGQTSISAFGRQSGTDTFGNNPNRTETASLRVAPTLVGSVGSLADYLVRLEGAGSSSRNFSAANSSYWSALGTLRSRGSGPLGWSLTAQRTDSSFQNRPSISLERVFGEANVKLGGGDLLLFARAGQERTDALDRNGRSYDTWGGGLRWAPSARTLVALESEKRYFGTSHRGTLEYRTPRTVWRYSDVQDTVDNTGLAGLTTARTLFDTLFESTAASIPDPVLRAQVIREQLLRQGRDPNQLIATGFLTTGLTVQRRQEFSAAYLGQRSSVAAQLFSRDARLVDPAAAAVPGIGPDGIRTRQSGLTLSASYRLTGATSFNSSATRLITPGQGLRVGTQLNSLSLGMTSRLDTRTLLSVNARIADFDSVIDPYRELLVSATLSLRF